MANEFNSDLPSNTMVFEVRRDNAVWPSFRENLEELMQKYGLSEAEKQAFRDIDVRRLGELGVHPYFLPQITRLFLGGAANSSNSAAAQAYRKSFGSAIID
jgi:hypothetical protein